jgi:predicted thioesterase
MIGGFKASHAASLSPSNRVKISITMCKIYGQRRASKDQAKESMKRIEKKTHFCSRMNFHMKAKNSL